MNRAGVALLVALVPSVGLARPARRLETTCVAEQQETAGRFTGFAIDRVPGVANELAEHKARDAARATLCGARTGPVCDRAMAAVLPLNNDVSRFGRDWAACARLQVPRDALDRTTRDLAALDARLAAFAKALPPALSLSTPRSQAGADAGDGGRAILVEVRAAAVRAGRSVAEQPGGGFVDVGLRLALARPGEAILTAVDAARGVDLTSLQLPTDLFGLDERALRDALWSDAFGIPSDGRPGAGGLRAAVTMSAADTTFCEGEALPLPTGTALGGRPGTELLLFDVDANLQAILVARQTGSVVTATEAGLALDTSGGRREAYVLVALPPGATDFAGWQPYCRVPKLDAAALPPGAAIGLAHYAILPAGVGTCARDPDPSLTTQRARAAESLAAMTPCGAR